MSEPIRSQSVMELAQDIVRGWDMLPSTAPGRFEELRLARALLDLREAVERIAEPCVNEGIDLLIEQARTWNGLGSVGDTAELFLDLAEALEAAEDQVVREIAARDYHRKNRDEARAERDALADALRKIAAQQPKTLERLRAGGVVFDEMPHRDPSNWQQVAFWIYTDLCTTETIARAALVALDPEATA